MRYGNCRPSADWPLHHNTRIHSLSDDWPCTESLCAPTIGRIRSPCGNKFGPGDWRRAYWNCEPNCLQSGRSLGRGSLLIEITQNMLTGTHRNLQVVVLSEMIIGVQKRMADV